MKRFKILALILSMAVSTSLIAGCSKTASSTTPATGSSSGVVNIVYSRGKDTTTGAKSIVDAFNKKYAGKIHVDLVELPNDSDKQHDQYVTVYSAGGTDYDVFDADVIWPAEFAEAGYALPLDKYIARDKINLTDYMPGPVQALTFKGKTWGLPRYIDAGFLFYRKDVVSSAPATWEDLAATAEKNKGKAKFSFIGQAKQYEGLVCNAVEFISAYGGSVVDGNGDITIKSDGTKQGLQMMKKIYTSDYVPNNITTFTETETENTFVSGDSVFARNWPYLWVSSQDTSKSKVAGKVEIAPLPKGSVRSASCLGGWTAMINKNSKHPEESWTFLKFLAGADGQKLSAINGGLAPTLTSLYQDADVQKASPIFSNPNFAAGLQTAVSRPVSPIYKKLSNIMQAEISKYLTGKEDVDTAISNMDTQMKDAVTSAGK